jgi:acyl carrier protein
MQELISTLKQQIVEQLNLKHIKPEEIGDDQPLFVDGLGLDSIDALELIVLLQQNTVLNWRTLKKDQRCFIPFVL